MKINSGYLLLVEDEREIQEANTRMLERRGYVLRQAYTLAEARAIMAKDMPRAIVLDIGLPDGSGLVFLHEIRKTSNVPVLMLTAMGTDEDIINGLKAGGDDYLPKPYDLMVFITRVETLLRRASLIPETISLGSLRLETASCMAYCGDEDMLLSKKEYSLLLLFVQQAEKVMGAKYIYEKVWGQEMIDGDDNALQKTISSLRKKLAGSDYTIAVSRGEGYCFERV